MDFIVIFGPPAVGKMTVGAALAQMSGLKLFHNHMTIELALNFFPYRSPHLFPLVNQLRLNVFEAVAASELPGLIFTYVWSFEDDSDKKQIDGYAEIFQKQGGTAYFVELEADLEARIERNKSAFRLEQKASKRNIEGSERHLLDVHNRRQHNTKNDFYYAENYIKINNTRLSSEETARRILEKFGLPPATL